MVASKKLRENDLHRSVNVNFSFQAKDRRRVGGRDTKNKGERRVRLEILVVI